MLPFAPVYLVLPIVALLAGFVDAVAGGGGMLTVPALLFVIEAVPVAFGTNKAQSVFGSGAALAAFWRAGKIDEARFAPTFAAAASGSLVGVLLVVRISNRVLQPLVLVLLAAAAVFVFVRGMRKKKDHDGPKGIAIARNRPKLVAALVSLVIGFYDGFFGPGTGTFLIVAFDACFGDGLEKATANAKVANFASNLAAVATFALMGRVDWRLALPMAAAQLAGGFLGAKAAMKGGERFVRVGVLVVTIALLGRLAWRILST